MDHAITVALCIYSPSQNLHLLHSRHSPNKPHTDATSGSTVIGWLVSFYFYYFLFFRSLTGQGKQKQPCSPRPTPQAPAGTPRTPPTTCMSSLMGHMVQESNVTDTMTGTAPVLILQLTPLVRRFNLLALILLGSLLSAWCCCSGVVDTGGMEDSCLTAFLCSLLSTKLQCAV